MKTSDQIRNLLIADIKRRLIVESVPRIHKCLDSLKLEEIWHKQNEHTNSVGNLVLHLCGNVRQYVLSGIDDQEDIRVRDLEFSEQGPIGEDSLKTMLDDLMEEVASALDRINAEDLIREVGVQGFQENVTSILVHVTEHFSYHVGQITYYTKFIKDMDTGYYAGLDLNAKG